MRVFTIKDGEIFEGAKVSFFTLKNGEKIPAIIVGEEGRNRHFGACEIKHSLARFNPIFNSLALGFQIVFQV